MADEKTPDLRDLANRWAMAARDYAREAKAPDATEAQANYRRGMADGYYKAATDLAEFIKQQGANGAGLAPRSPAPPAAPPPPRPDPNAGGRRGVSPSATTQRLTDEMKAAAMARAQSASGSVASPATAPAADAPVYEAVSVGEVLSILDYARINVRDITPNKDNTFLLVFSSWENIMPHERVERIKKADMRIVVLRSGKMKDSNDPYVELGFKPLGGQQ